MAILHIELLRLRLATFWMSRFHQTNIIHLRLAAPEITDQQRTQLNMALEYDGDISSVFFASSRLNPMDFTGARGSIWCSPKSNVYRNCS